ARVRRGDVHTTVAASVYGFGVDALDVVPRRSECVMYRLCGLDESTLVCTCLAVGRAPILVHDTALEQGRGARGGVEGAPVYVMDERWGGLVLADLVDHRLCFGEGVDRNAPDGEIREECVEKRYLEVRVGGVAPV